MEAFKLFLNLNQHVMVITAFISFDTSVFSPAPPTYLLTISQAAQIFPLAPLHQRAKACRWRQAHEDKSYLAYLNLL